MDTEGTQDAPHTAAPPPGGTHRTDPTVPRPAAPPAAPATPPPPAAPPLMPAQAAKAAAAEPPVLGWLRTPRPAAAPGIWTYGHAPRPAEEPDRVPLRQLVSGAVISFLCGWLLWSLLWNGYLGSYWLWPLLLLTPDSWREAAATRWSTSGRPTSLRPVPRSAGRRLRPPGPLARTRPPLPGSRAPAPSPPGAGRGPRARRGPRAMARAARPGCPGRSREAGRGGSRRPDERRGRGPDRTRMAFGAVRQELPRRLHRHRAAARRRGLCPPLGAARPAPQDRPPRSAHPPGPDRHRRRPPAQPVPAPRAPDVALARALLGTSLLAVGPSGSGKTRRLVRPVVESMCLQALAGHRPRSSPSGRPAPTSGPDEAFDVVVKIGRPDAECDLDLYGGTTDPDEAAGILAEALVGDLVSSCRAATAGAPRPRSPSCWAPSGRPATASPPWRSCASCWTARRRRSPPCAPRWRTPAEHALLRELDARARQAERAGDVGVLLADRIALLDRPAFAGFFDPTGGHPAGLAARPGSPAAGPHRPARARPRRGLTDPRAAGPGPVHRLRRRPQPTVRCSPAWCWTTPRTTITAEALRGLQRLRSANAGAVLTLRSLDDVPEALRSAPARARSAAGWRSRA